MATSLHGSGPVWLALLVPLGQSLFLCSSAVTMGGTSSWSIYLGLCIENVYSLKVSMYCVSSVGQRDDWEVYLLLSQLQQIVAVDLLFD